MDFETSFHACEPSLATASRRLPIFKPLIKQGDYWNNRNIIRPTAAHGTKPLYFMVPMSDVVHKVGRYPTTL